VYTTRPLNGDVPPAAPHLCVNGLDCSCTALAGVHHHLHTRASAIVCTSSQSDRTGTQRSRNCCAHLGNNISTPVPLRPTALVHFRRLSIILPPNLNEQHEHEHDCEHCGAAGQVLVQSIAATLRCGAYTHPLPASPPRSRYRTAAADPCSVVDNRHSLNCRNSETESQE
jgi:hypothetical protein